MNSAHGIHHITAVSSDAQGNLDFYTETLGLRLTKLSVNFDDPSVYHFYFTDRVGTPGSVLTFFPWEGVRRGRIGTSSVSAVPFAAPVGSLGQWVERLASSGARIGEITELFGNKVLRFQDPEGLPLELVETGLVGEEMQPWQSHETSEQMALAGFGGVTLAVKDKAQTVELLKDVLGYRELGNEGAITRYVTGDGVASQTVDILELPNGAPGTGGAGTVHHVAFRAADEDEQTRLSNAISEFGLQITPLRDRNYFKSVYFHEPNGILFEIATDGPGFMIDETEEKLGTALKLPPQYESHRKRIEASLPPLVIAQTGIVAP